MAADVVISKVFNFLGKCYKQCVSKNGEKKYSWMASPLPLFGKKKMVPA